MWTTGRIAQLLGVPCEGPSDRVLSGVAPLEAAHRDQLAFCAGKRPSLADTRAGAVILSVGEVPPDTVALRHVNPRWAFAKAAAALVPAAPMRSGIHHTASVDPAASVDSSAAVGPYAVVGAGARVGPRSELAAHSVVEAGAQLGADCRLEAHAVVMGNAVVGDGVRIGPHAVVGAEGFGVAVGPDGLLDFPQLGTTVLEDDVRIGPSSIVCRGALGETRVGKGTRTDSFVQIAHNVRVGRDCLLAAFVGLAGGARLGDGVQMGGRAAVIDGIAVGDRARFAALASAWRDVPEDQQVGGAPARPHLRWLREVAALNRLPAALKVLDRLARRQGEEDG